MASIINQATPAFMVIVLLLSAAANPLFAAGIAGVPVKLTCTNILGAEVTAGQTTTDTAGGFDGTVSNLLSTLGGPLDPNSLIPCNVVVSLPLNQTRRSSAKRVFGATVLSLDDAVALTVAGQIGTAPAGA